jgi:hypothetical protein
MKDFQALVDDGLPVERAVVYLHEKGFTIAETIKIIMERYSLTLGESKSIVTRSDSWEKVVAASDSLHEDLLANDPHRTDQGDEEDQ